MQGKLDAGLSIGQIIATVDDRAAEVKGDNAASALTRARGAAGLHAYAEHRSTLSDRQVRARVRNYRVVAWAATGSVPASDRECRLPVARPTIGTTCAMSTR